MASNHAQIWDSDIDLIGSLPHLEVHASHCDGVTARGGRFSDGVLFSIPP